MTGRKVIQTGPHRLDSTMEWEPVNDGAHVKIRTRYGNYLRANGGLPPWRNSVTHDVPHRTTTKDWVLWNVDIVDMDHFDQIQEKKEEKMGQDLGWGILKFGHSDSFGLELSSLSIGSDRFQRQESNDSGIYSPSKPDGRLFYYHVADELGDVNEDVEGSSFTFKGHSVAELTGKIEEATGLQDIFVCIGSPLNAKLYPLRLQLPPNTATMRIVVPSTSKLAREFSKMRIS